MTTQTDSAEVAPLADTGAQAHVLSTAVQMINQLATTRLSLTTTRSLGAEPGPPALASDSHFYLLVIEESLSYLFPLPHHGELVVGRAANADLRLSSPAASRQHAKLRVTPAYLQCEDLSSHNGSSINGERLSGVRTLHAGDILTICTTQLVVYRGPQSAPTLALRSQAELRLQLPQELQRCQLHRCPLAVVYLDIGEPLSTTGLQVSKLPGLRTTDFVAQGDAKTTLWLLLPARADSDVRELLKTLLQQLAAVTPAALASYAMYPADGSDADTLMNAARSSASSTEPGSIRTPRDIPPIRQLGSLAVIVADNAMMRIYDLVERLAAADLPVLIHGETGSGKDVVARALHACSKRRAQRFVALNCAALQDTLLESELFGHERGAFTGAVCAKPGLIEQADGGTLFLDEVAELSASAQTKLLRALETKKVVRVGGTQERDTNARIVAATHADLAERVKEGRFREDLFYRLRHAQVVLPPLRSRPRELPYLARAFLTECAQRSDQQVLLLSDEVMALLQSYPWPGNVRELRAAMEYAAATADGPLIHTWNLPDWVTAHSCAAAHNSSAVVAVPSDFRPLADELADLERTRMHQALLAASGVQLRAAELLRMPERTFYMKAKQYGLVTKSRRPSAD